MADAARMFFTHEGMVSGRLGLPENSDTIIII